MIAGALPILLLASALTAATTAPSGATGASSVTAYELRLDLRGDGSADVALDLRLDAGAEAVARIPLPWPELAEAHLTKAPPSTSFALAPSGDRSTVTLQLPDATRGATEVRLEGRVAGVLGDGSPAGRSLRVALMNLEPGTMRDVRFLITFPDGFRAHAIREALPKAGKAEASPRAILEAMGDRLGVRLRVDALPQGETAALRVDLAPVRRSPGWLIVGVALSLLYLRSFRDLVSPKKK